MTRAFVRWVALVAAILLIAQGAVAWAFVSLDSRGSFDADCCDSQAETEHSDGDRDDDRPACPCPLDCSKGCAGAMTRGILPTLPDLVGGLRLAVPLSAQLPTGRPANTDSADILHVPKS
jgi:hypothetical protein